MIPSTQRFSNRVDYYVRSRPKYPAALLRFFQSELSLSPLHVVADVGSGTGLLTELFVRNGNPTHAIEPNAPMRAAAESYLSQWPNFHSVDATAEATTLPDASVDFVTAGQAFHWFNAPQAAREFRRILRPKGVAVLIWNERVANGSPFMIDYDRLMQKYRREPTPADDGMTDIKNFFSPAGFQSASFENPQTLDWQGMIDRIASSSYMPLPHEPGHDELLNEAHQLFDNHQQSATVQILHDTQVFYGPLIHQ